MELESEPPKKTFRVRIVAIITAMVLLAGFGFFFRNKPGDSIRHQIEDSILANDWQIFASLIPDKVLENSSLDRRSLQNFLTKYIDPARPLKVNESGDGSHMRIDFDYDNDSIPNLSLIQIDLISDHAWVPISISSATVKFEFLMTLASVSNHEFSDTQRFSPKKKVRDWVSAQYLFSLKHRDELKRLGLILKPSGDYDWQKRADHTRAWLIREKWPVAKLLDHYQVADPKFVR